MGKKDNENKNLDQKAKQKKGKANADAKDIKNHAKSAEAEKTIEEKEKTSQQTDKIDQKEDKNPLKTEESNTDTVAKDTDQNKEYETEPESLTGEDSDQSKIVGAEKDSTTKDNKSNKNKMPLLIVGGIILAFILGFVAIKSISNSPVKEGKSLVITSANEKDFKENGQFVLSGLDKFDLTYVKENLSFEPEVEYEIVESGKDFIVTLKNFRNIGYAGRFIYNDSSGKSRQDVFRVNGKGLTVSLESKEIQRYAPLILTFSEQVDARSLEANLTITPNTPHTIEYDLDTVMIYPDDQWQLTSQYKVGINAEYASKNGKEFAYHQALTFAIVKPDSEGGGRYYPEVVFNNDDNFIITPDVKMVLRFFGQGLTKDVPVKIETFSLNSIENFKAESHIYLDYDVKLDALEKISTDKFSIKEKENRFEIDNPGEGAYLVRATFNDPNDPSKTLEVRTGYLVTNYSVYMQSSKNETLAWVHNGSTKSPVSGYTVQLGEPDQPSGITDKDGVALIPHAEIETLEDESEYYNYRGSRTTAITEFSVYNGKKELVYYDDANLRKSSGEIIDLYYSYLFLDRSLYRPEDTISFWGFVKPFRTNQQEMPKTVNVIFDQGGLDLTVEVNVNTEGVFTGEIKLEQIKSSQYTVTSSLVYSNDGIDTVVTLNDEYITVKDFQKPAYSIETSIDKDYYGANDTVRVKATPTFYDGTPVPNFPLEVFYRENNYGEWVKLPNITTDDKGSATFDFKVPPKNQDYDEYITLSPNYYRVQIASDGESVTNVGSYDCLYIDYIIEQKISKQSDGKNISLELNSYRVDLTKTAFKDAYKKADAGDYYDRYQLFNEKNLLTYAKGDPVDVEVNLELRWRYTDSKKIEHANRQYNPTEVYLFENNYSLDYEFVPKSDIEIINDWETKEKKISATTVNGKAVIDNLIYLPEGSEIDFSKEVVCRSKAIYKDSFKNTYSSYYFYPSSAEFYNWDYMDLDETTAPKGFTFKITDKASGENLTPTSNYYRRVSLDINSPANFQLLLDGAPVDKNGTILYTIIQGGLYEHKIVNANDFDLSMMIDYSPSAQLVAAYFDGERTHFIQNLDLTASDESLSINIDITPDKDSYRPGETAKLTIKSTDRVGKGVAGNIAVAVVDESIFALSEQYVDVLNTLYSSLWYMDNYVSKYSTTYRSGGANSGLWSGGKGDGDGSEFSSYRSNFKDTASFITTRTDSNGESKIEFVLPDNITSWRITAVEIGDQLLAGSAKTNIISTQPFFVKPVTSSKYIDGDDVSMLVQGHGISLDKDSEIKYTVTLSGDGFNETLTSTGKAYGAIEFNFGKLAIGSYTLKSMAEFNGQSDTVEIPINVIKSNLELVVNKPIDIATNKPVDISAARFPVSLSFYSDKNLPFFQSVNSLFGHYCMMPSQRLSRFTAKRVLRDSVVNDEIPYYISKGNDSVADMQQGDGGIGASADSASELTLSTYLTLIAKNQFNQKTLADYFRTSLNTAKNDKARASAYLGLAALNETTKEEILKQLGVDEKGKFNSNKELSLDTKAYYITALAYLDETDLSTKLYMSELKPHISNIEQRPKVNYYSYQYNQTDLNWERDTAAIWVAASKIDQTDADRISSYFADFSWRYRTLFEAMIYVTNYSTPIEQLSYSYTLNGETITNKIGLSGMSTLVLSKSELEDIRFTQIPNDLKAFAYYVGEPSEIDITPSENLKITKEVTPISDSTYKVTLKLELSEDAPTGEYNISDWIPSNSRLYESHKTEYNSSNYSYMTTEAQKVYIDFYHVQAGKHAETITYTIRQTYSAEAMLDTVYVIHGESGENCSSEPRLFVPENSNVTIPFVHLDPSKNSTDKK